MMLKVIAKVVVKPEKMEEAEILMKSLVPITQNEEGCISYEVFKETDKTDTYYFVETWKSKESLDQHLSNDHMIQFVKSGAELFSEPLDVSLLNTF